MVEGSTWGRAGRFFLRMIFFTFFSVRAAISLLDIVRAVGSLSDSVSRGAMVVGVALSTSAILIVCRVVVWKAEKIMSMGKAENEFTRHILSGKGAAFSDFINSDFNPGIPFFSLLIFDFDVIFLLSAILVFGLLFLRFMLVTYV